MKNTKQYILSILVIAIVVIGAASLIKDKSGLPAQTGGPAAVGFSLAALDEFDPAEPIDLETGITGFEDGKQLNYLFNYRLHRVNEFGDPVEIIHEEVVPGSQLELVIREGIELLVWKMPGGTLGDKSMIVGWTNQACDIADPAFCGKFASVLQYFRSSPAPPPPPPSEVSEVVEVAPEPSIDVRDLVDFYVTTPAGGCLFYDGLVWKDVTTTDSKCAELLAAEELKVEELVVPYFQAADDLYFLQYVDNVWTRLSLEESQQLARKLGVQAPAEEFVVAPEEAPTVLGRAVRVIGQSFGKVYTTVGEFAVNLWRNIFGIERPELPGVSVESIRGVKLNVGASEDAQISRTDRRGFFGTYHGLTVENVNPERSLQTYISPTRNRQIMLNANIPPFGSFDLRREDDDELYITSGASPLDFDVSIDGMEIAGVDIEAGQVLMFDFDPNLKGAEGVMVFNPIDGRPIDFNLRWDNIIPVGPEESLLIAQGEGAHPKVTANGLEPDSGLVSGLYKAPEKDLVDGSNIGSVVVWKPRTFGVPVDFKQELLDNEAKIAYGEILATNYPLMSQSINADLGVLAVLKLNITDADNGNPAQIAPGGIELIFTSYEQSSRDVKLPLVLVFNKEDKIKSFHFNSDDYTLAELQNVFGANVPTGFLTKQGKQGEPFFISSNIHNVSRILLVGVLPVRSPVLNCDVLGQDLLDLRNDLNALDPQNFSSLSDYAAALNQIKNDISSKLIQLLRNDCDCEKRIQGLQNDLASSTSSINTIVTAIDKLLGCLGIEIEEPPIVECECYKLIGIADPIPSVTYIKTLSGKFEPAPPGSIGDWMEVPCESVPEDLLATEDYEKVCEPAADGIDLSIEKLQNSPFYYNASGSYAINVTNNGPDDASDPITVVDDLPAGFTFDLSSSGGNGWSCFASGQQVVCTYTGPSIPAGGSFPLLVIGVSVVPIGQWPWDSDIAQNCATVGFPAPAPGYFIHDLDSDNSRDCFDTIVQTIQP